MAIDAQRLRAQCIYEGRGPLGSLLVDLDEIGNILQAIQTHRRTLRRLSGLCLIVFVAGIIASIVGESTLWLLLGIIAFIACLALFIYSFLYSNKLVGHRNRYDLMKQLLGNIQRDAHAKANFAVRLSMASAAQLLSEEPWTVRNGKQKFFRESWLSIEGPLLDGTTLSEEVTELSRKRTYKNSNGKWKSKTRNRYLLTLRFAYPKDLYGDARPAQLALHEEVRVPPSALVRDVRVSEKAIAMKGLVKLENEIAQTAGMLSMGTYRMLNLARRAAASQRGGAR